MNEWQGVSEFVAVAETESFTRAANRLEISTAQVSRQIQTLEQRLGVKLFYRTTRRVSLTEAGQLYYQSCRPLLDALNDAERTLSQLQSVPQGTLRVTAPVTYGERQLMPLLNRFLQDNPRLSLQCDLTNKKMDMVEGNYDLAIRLGRLENEDLIARRLGTRRLYTCASRDYLDHYGTPDTLSELSRHSCLVGSLDYWRFRDSRGERMVRIHGRLRCNSGEALMDAARRGLGIVQLPDYYALPYLENGSVREILTNYAPDDEGIWALCLPGRQLSPKVRILLDYLTHVLAAGADDQKP